MEVVDAEQTAIRVFEGEGTAGSDRGAVALMTRRNEALLARRLSRGR